VRLGVSAKIFLAYAVLLVAFAASSILSVVYLHRGRQEMAADQQRRQILVAVEGLRTALGAFSEALKSGPGALPSDRVAVISAIPTARQYLADGRDAVDSYLERGAPAASRQEFKRYRHELQALETRLSEVVLKGSSRRGAEPSADAALAYLISDVRRLVDELTNGSLSSAEDLLWVGRRAVNAALMLGGLGLLAAVGAGLFMMRTLRPLHVLRVHARQIAGGDYGRRIEVPSRDEIGDLAREFDAMGRAIEEREHRLIRSERLATVGRMAAQITHEIRNPLASLGLYVELLGDELPAGDGEARRLAAAIGNEIDRLSEITETYLRFVRLPRPKLEREDLGAIALAVLEFARAELALARIELELDLAPGLPEVAADENQIRQALLNLVRNAKEAMPGGGKLRVEVRPMGSQVRLTVSDTGPGIAAEHLGKIFDPFFSTKDKGTGLGLALVQQIVAEHGGRIEVAAPPGGGTTFLISLPAVPSLAAVSAAEVTPPAEPEPAPVTDDLLAAAVPRGR
jgi:two-component system NtrC family sensor kinase